MQRADTPNQNKRIYPRKLLYREMDNFMRCVKENRAMGECDHPESSTVSLKNVSHVVREAWWDGDNVMGKIEVLPTPSGRILEALIDSGITLGISSLEALQILASHSPKETAYFLGQNLKAPDNPDTAALTRKCLPHFPPEVQESLRASLRGNLDKH